MFINFVQLQKMVSFSFYVKSCMFKFMYMLIWCHVVSFFWFRYMYIYVIQ